jgi:hypothetical protein
MVLAGGTGTAWHICKTIREYYKATHLIVCDINQEYLVHSSIFADEFITILPIANQNYEEYMHGLFIRHHINILIPIIDFDLRIFSCDNERLLANNVLSTAPKKYTFDTLSNKKDMNKFLSKIGIRTPDIYSMDSIDLQKEYYVKDIIGFGSRGAYKTSGKNIGAIKSEKLIQEICYQPEVSSDVFVYNDKIFSICRERIEVKSGVCTKARIFYDHGIQEIITKIANVVELPIVSCIQFMKNNAGDWSLTDFNLRPGAGTAMSAATGFQCVHAALIVWMKTHENIECMFEYPNEDKYVVRAYREIILNT